MKDFVKKIKLEDSRIALKRQKLERIAKARVGATATQANLPHTVTPAIIVSGTQAEPSAQRPEVLLSPHAAPLPTLAGPTLAGPTSPLHPSLPPKPGAASKNLQEPSKNAVPTSVAPPLAPTPPVRISTPVSQHVSAPEDPEIAKYEEVSVGCDTLDAASDKSNRISNDGHGSRFGPLETNICNTSGELVQETYKHLPKKLKRGKTRRERKAPVAWQLTILFLEALHLVPRPLRIAQRQHRKTVRGI